MPQAELYDGTILEFEDGTPNDVIERVARQHTDSLRTEEARRPLPQGVKPSEAGGGRGFVQPTAEPAQAPAPAVAAPSKPDQQPWRIGGRGTAPVKAPPTKDQQLLESLTAPADGGYTASQIEEGTIEPGRLERMRQDRAAAAKGVPEARALSPAQEMAADFRDFTKNPVARGAVAGLSGLGQVGIGATRLAADLVGADSVADFAAATSRTAGTIGGGMTQDLGGNDKLVADVTASIMQSAPSLAVGTVGGPALSTLFTQTALAEYNEGRNSGFDVGASLARGGIMGMAEAVGERFGFPQQIKLLRGVVRDMPPNELAKTLGELIKKEIPGEQLTTALQFLADKAGPAAQNPNATFADYLEQAGETLKTTVAQTAVMGGGPAVLAQGRINDAAVGRSALTQAERLAMDKWGANPYAIANARGFRVDPPLVSDDAKSQRAKTAAIFENTAAQYGIPSGAVSRAKAAAEGLPIDQLGPFYSRFVQALQKRNLVGSQVDAHVIDSLEAGPVVLPEEREAQAAASGTAKAASGTGKPASAPPKTDTATAEPDYSGLSEPGGPAQVAGIDEAAHAAATSPQNDLQEPTPAQQDAGNYRKGHHRIGGLDVSIENPQGSIRRSKPNAPVKWETEMQHHYGYIRGTVGQDGDHIDTFVKPGTADDFSGTVFVVDQVDPGTGKPDEHKVMLGFDTEAEARDAYLSNYQSGWKGLGAITATPMADFKTWLKGDTNKPFGETTRAPQQPDVQPVAGVAERAPAGGGAEPAGGGRVVGRGAADAGRGGLPSAGAPAPGGGAAAAVGTGGRRSGAVEETTGDKINREWESNYQRVQDDLAGSSITDIRRAISYASRIVTRLQPAAFAGDQASKDQITGVRKEIAFLNDEIKRKEAIGPARTIGRVGDMPTQTAPLELRANADGTVTPWLDGFELVDFESGEPLRLPGSTSDAQAVAAIKAAGAVGRSKKFFGVAQDAAPAPKKPGRSRALDPDADTLLQALAKLGGVQRQGMASEFGLRPEELKHSVAVAGLKGYPFRAKGGLSVDAAIAAVREAGYLAGVSDKDARHAFEDAVHKELGGGQALTPQGEMSRAAAAHEEHAVHAEEMDQAANDERAAIMAEAGLSEAEMAAVEDDDIDVAGTSNTSTDAFMRAMGFTEEEITRETRARAPVGAQEDGAATGRKAGAAAGSGGPEAGPAAAPTEEVLTAPTATGLRGAAERRRRTEQSDRGKQRNLAAKAQADAERGEFALTGSDRPADVAAAAGQGGLFEAPAVSKNTIFTEDAAERARAMLRAKLEKPGGPGKKKGQGGAIDPEVFQAGITLAGYHIEKGARTFSAYAKAMLEDLGEAVRPYLKSWYAAVYYDPRATALQADMTPPAKLDEAAAAAEEQGNVRDADTGVERDRGDAGDVEREVGETLSGRGLGEGPQTAGKRTGSARRGRPDDAGVPTGGASPLRELGDQPVRGRDRAAEPSLFDAGTVDGERSDDPGIQGVQPDPRPAGPAARPAVAWASAAEKRAAQRAAEGVKQEPGIDNIRATLPYLQPAQQDDVFKAEQRFAKPDGYGMLFTNGTGTGKTFSGLGIVKRFVRAGKREVLIVVPDAKIMADWIESGTALGLDIKALADTKDAGRGVTITTYANLGENDALATRSWDLVVPDEVHMLMQSADGKQTKALDALRAITLHPRGVEDRFTMLNRDDVNERRDLSARIRELDKARLGTDAETREKLTDKIGALRKRLDQLNEMLVAERKRVQEDVLDRQGEPRTRVVGLSATPFAYEKTVDWADGYLFDYAPGGAEEQAIPGYNEGDARAKFFVQHFGYRMRYNKLTEPDSKVDRGLLQRQFNGWLKKQGVLSGRMLDVAADYDRRFILAESAVGNEIDRAIEWIREQAKASRIAKKDEPDAVDGWAYVEAELNDQLFGKTGHLVRRYLLEAIKAKEVVQHVREHMALGRKVVVFHDFKKGGSHNPFAFEHRPAPRQPGEGMDAEAFQKYLLALGARNDAAAAFRREFPNLAGDRLLAELVSPIVRFKKEFPDVLLINGDEKPSDLLGRYKRFNDDTVGPAVALVQSAKNKGWSGHDTTGKHQRVLFNLGLPTQPTMSIQQEGRIYRTGQVSNAIFRYLNTGTNWERWAFAQTIAERASAAENLATGELARALKDAFIAGFEESGDFPAGHEGEGTGGKERDRMANEAISEYDRAKAFYWGTAKKTAKTKSQEGADYFATPEPVGFKMVQMLDLRGGEDALEPSAGHGAIARWFPETANRTAVEPSNTLGSRLAMVFDGKIVRGDFEALNIVNKYDGIAMNPPFGTAGRTAVDHLAKAAQQHLREGGRVVALIPTGPAADKKFEKWFYEEDTRPAKPLGVIVINGKETPVYKGDTVESHPQAFWAPGGTIAGWRDGVPMVKATAAVFRGAAAAVSKESIKSVQPTGARTETFKPAEGLYLVADIKLPAVTFERAGTQVMTRIVVLEKVAKDDPPPALVQRDYTGVKDINELFDRMEDLQLPARVGAPAAEEVDARAAAAAPAPAAAPKTTQKAENAAAAQQGVALAAATGATLVEHTTGKGKLLKGVIRKDLTREQAEQVDEYTFKKDGGFFIRAEHLKKLAEKFPDAQMDLGRQPMLAAEVVEGDADPRDVAAVADLQGKINRVKAKPVTLTALPPAPRPPAGASRAEVERFAATDLVKKLFGKRAVFFAADGGAVNGAALASQPKVLFVNEATRRPVMAVLGHELLHQMRRDNPQLYDRLADRLDQLVKNPGEHFMEFVERYTAGGVAIPDVQKIREELVADIVGDNFTDPAFWRSLQEGQPGLFQRVLGAVRDFLNGVLERLRNERPFGTDKYLSDVVASRDAVAQAMKEYAGSQAAGQSKSDQSSDDVSLSVDRHTPEQRAALARAGIDTRGRLQRAGDKIREFYGRAVEAWKDNWARQFQQGYLDQFTGIAQAVERELGGLPVDQDPYVAARLANGGTSSVMRGLLLHGQASWAANGQHLEKIPGTRGLLDILAPLGDDLNDFFGWMIGNRAARLAKEGRERNLTPEQMQTLQDLAKGKEAKFRAAALEYAAFKRSVLDIAEHAGLIDGEARKVWDNADYIPFYRKIDQEAVFTATGKKGLAGQSSGIRTLKGGEAALNDPLENIIMNFSRLVDASLKNRAIAKTVGLLEQAGSDVVTREGMTFSKEMVPAGQVKKVLRDAGTPDVVMDIIPDTAFAGMAKMWAMQPPSDPDIVRVMVGGSPRYYRVNDPLLLKALTSFVPFDFPGLGVLRAFKRILTAGVTAAPPFWIRNFVRDTAAAQLVGRDGFFPGKSLSGIVKSYRETGAGEAMLFSGASFQSGQVNAGDPAGTGAAIRRALRRRGFNAATAEGFVGTVIDTPARWWEHYRQVGDAIENSNREAIYEATTKAGKGATAAAYESKDLMDFTLRGSSPVYQFLADVLPFFNARVQGLYRLGRANPKRLAAYGMLMMAASLALAWLNEDNDEYNELPDWDKDNYWHFWIRGEHFRLPKPFELGVAFATIPERIMRYIRGQDTGKKVASRITHDIIEQFAFDPVPQAIRPALNVAMNRDTFRDRPIESMSDTKKQPAQRYSALTSPAAVKLAQAAEPLVNAAGLGPKKLEYLVNAYLGTVGAYALGLSDLAVAAMDNKAPAPARRLDDLPMVREFYRMDPPRGTVFEQDLYALRAEVEEIYATVQDKAKKGDKEGAVALAKEEATKLALRPQVKSATELLQDLNKKRDAIYADKKMTPEKKREEIDKILSMKALISKKLMGNPVVRSTQ